MSAVPRPDSPYTLYEGKPPPKWLRCLCAVLATSQDIYVKHEKVENQAQEFSAFLENGYLYKFRGSFVS